MGFRFLTRCTHTPTNQKHIIWPFFLSYFFSSVTNWPICRQFIQLPSSSVKSSKDQCRWRWRQLVLIWGVLLFASFSSSLLDHCLMCYWCPKQQQQQQQHNVSFIHWFIKMVSSSSWSLNVATLSLTFELRPLLSPLFRLDSIDR